MGPARILGGALIIATGTLEAKICPPDPPKAIPVAEVTISPEACRYLARQAMADTLRYRPGIDSEGRAVTSADLPRDQPEPEFTRTITVDIAPTLAYWLPNQRYPYDTLDLSRVNLGLITVTGGILSFNGQPLGDSHDDDLLDLCLTSKRR